MLKCIHSHYDYGDYYKRSPDDGYQNIPQMGYLNNPGMYPISNNYNYMPEECICSCDICYSNPKECCMQYCTKCTEENRSELVYYPYPYYIINSPSPSIPKPTEAQIKIETTTTTTTTQAVTTETEEGLEQTSIARMDNEGLSEDAIQNSYIKELLENARYNKNDVKVMLTSLRRTKPRWMPKFGIVPIPDQLAENLMLKIRNMKVLHPEKDTLRRIESIYPRSEQ
ncbi:hypothetical protein RR48_12352 [Papilio machaon]|uniref:Uncharacterized protein n=1 Tax=Papilio machaon TaxID=76193 RepID=A0A194QTG2_PAPMA|nr:hypothetical protein RR48_12352 [Papilio machaon]